jgi:hypothetical protein
MPRMLSSRGWWIVAALVAAAGIAASIRATSVTRTPVDRRPAYQASLETFARVLKPGMTRGEVRAYLQRQGRPTVQMCCMRPRHSKAFDVLTKIGEESPPWYCSAHNVYVGFEFDAVSERQDVEADERDVLREVRLYDWLEGCL